MIFVLAIATLALAPVGWAVWTWRVAQLRRLAREDAAPAARASAAAPRVSLVVPARDEAHNLPRLLASIARLEPAPFEVIVVDDHSSDGTGDLARAAGATVIVPPPLPDGWIGKSWACHAGAQAARGDLLLFTDADTEHGHASLGRAVARVDAGAALVSIVPRHRIASWWERLQGPFQLLLLVAGRAGARATRGARRYAIGQYLLFTREAYTSCGGHAAVRDRVAEDLHLAARVAARGGRVDLVHAPDALAVRMYPEGLGGFARGWRRSLRAGMTAAGAGGAVEMIAVLAWLLGVPLGLGLALAVGAAPWAWGAGLAYLATALVLARDQREVGALPAWSALAYPLPALAFAALSAVAAVDHLRGAPVRWRGRTIAAGGVRARLEAEHLAWNLDAVAPAVRAGDRVLDLGAWDNKLGAALRDRLGARVVGADVVDRNTTDVELRLLQDGRVPTAPGETFDVVLLLYVLHHAPDDRALLAEARRVLAAGGRVVVGEDRCDTPLHRARAVLFHVWLRLFARMRRDGDFRTTDGWRARFAEVGLEVVDHRTLGACRWWFPVNDVYVLVPATAPLRA